MQFYKSLQAQTAVKPTTLPLFQKGRKALGMPPTPFWMSSFNTGHPLTTSKTQPITTRWWLYTSYVHSYLLQDIRKGT